MKRIIAMLAVFTAFTICVQGQAPDTLSKKNDSTAQNVKVHKKDSTRRVVLSFGYQPAVGGDFFGAGIYLNSLVSIVGIYGSMTGLRKVETGDQANFIDKTDVPVVTNTHRNWYSINFGISLKTANNFYIYGGYSTGSYSDWVTTTYTPLPAAKRKPYTVVNEVESKKPGADFGAMYYAGTGIVRFALQLGYNTSMKSVIAGIQMGFFIK